MTFIKGYITKHLQPVCCTEGEKAVLLCEVLEGAGVCRWLKDGTEITSDKKYNMVEKGKERQLEITSVGLLDGGTYCVDVKGQRSAADIRVKGINSLYLILPVNIHF